MTPEASPGNLGHIDPPRAPSNLLTALRVAEAPVRGPRRLRATAVLLGLAALTSVASCRSEGTGGTSPIDRCRGVVCPLAGTACAAEDGQCRCGEGGPICGEGERCEAAEARCEVPLRAVCTSGSRWAPGTAAFREVTEAWGLMGVEGTRLAVGDIDGDGWPDVFVRRGGNGSDDFSEEGTRRSWLLRNTGGGRFEDVTIASGVRATRVDESGLGRPGEVVAFADVDNDGDLDLYTGMSTGIDGAMEDETSELMLNDGSGRFTLGPEQSELRRAGQVDIPAGAAFVDFDRDGNIDLWVGQHNYAPRGTQRTVFRGDHLYRGDGAGGFVEVTAEVGLETADWARLDDIDAALAHSRAWSAAACDLNGDGTPELLVASYGRAPNHLWQGHRDGEGRVGFENRSVASGYAFDDNQAWQDNEFARCFCQSRPNAEGCEGAPSPRIECNQQNWQHETDRRPFRLGGNSGTTVCADVNNDGHLDLLTTEITHWWAGVGSDRSELLVNGGEAEVRFERPGLGATGLERRNPPANWDNGDMTAAVFDFDNDGWPDIYIGASDYPGNRGLLFQQVEPGLFRAVPFAEGIDHHRSHGIVVADFDRDGDLDVLVGHSRARCSGGGAAPCYPTMQVRLFENVLGDAGNWVQLRLVGGEGTNRAAIGARVEVTAGGVTQTQEVGGGHGHYGMQHDMLLHFGLGEACEAEVKVRWPDAALTTETFRVLAGHRFEKVQGREATVVPRGP